ncbi:hypothetical protein RGU72_04610 [Undibacterium sp. 5I1]|uniref:exodeoxyribonuclease X C-terminal domain-containing protein n=1 Tax=unclassified Undibacterium TaxID=2630295 RepID=UPI002AB3D861|nr:MULTISPECIES: hypothetical protein [unclassified Undibacterium]MDY7537533.1 hypothetical protein [Undibacterium sp. 5I1]MEB0231917.1 hypothetical protein [Undibacterium sp. 10I3]MEB0256268.1 hypothetical protein [Undibacterium sp. 5I1]
MGLKLTDTLDFGKHKGSKIEDVYKADAGYLVWLRQERHSKNGETKFFASEMHILLDDCIRNSKSLRSKYSVWEVTVPGIEIEPSVEVQAARSLSAQAYQEQWGVY